MTDLKALIKQGEGISVEFKECRHALSQDIYKTPTLSYTKRIQLSRHKSQGKSQGKSKVFLMLVEAK